MYNKLYQIDNKMCDFYGVFIKFIPISETRYIYSIWSSTKNSTVFERFQPKIITNNWILIIGILYPSRGSLFCNIVTFEHQFATNILQYYITTRYDLTCIIKCDIGLEMFASVSYNYEKYLV